MHMAGQSAATLQALVSRYLQKYKIILGVAGKHAREYILATTRCGCQMTPFLQV